MSDPKAEEPDWERCETCWRPIDTGLLDEDGNCERCADEKAVLANGPEYDGDKDDN